MLTELSHSQFLRVSDLHCLYLEESGNPDGVPVVVLHGGPGAGFNPGVRQLFDPEFYRVILFDQRGAGHSTPKGETRENTLKDLVADLEKFVSIVILTSGWSLEVPGAALLPWHTALRTLIPALASFCVVSF